MRFGRMDFLFGNIVFHSSTKYTQLYFNHIEPTAMLGCVKGLQFSEDPSSFLQRWKCHQASLEVTPVTRCAHPGSPSAGTEPDVMGYALTGSVQAFLPGVEDAKLSFGKFILATNDLDNQNLSAAAMLENYTAQGVSVERGFRFLKDPLFFADSLFLKSPARIMALIMIMGLALLVFALGERQLRLALK